MAGLKPEDKRNDMRLLTPLLMMALIVACGFLYFAFEAASTTTG
jgi:hypothetical protein